MLELNNIFFGRGFKKRYYWLHYTKSVVTTPPPSQQAKILFSLLNNFFSGTVKPTKLEFFTTLYDTKVH